MNYQKLMDCVISRLTFELYAMYATNNVNNAIFSIDLRHPIGDEEFMFNITWMDEVMVVLKVNKVQMIG